MITLITSYGDVLALPEHLMSLKILLICIFILHLIPVNLAVGGSILTAISAAASGRNPHQAYLGKKLSNLIPRIIRYSVIVIVVSLIVTEVLSGQNFPLRELLSSTAWYTALSLLIIGYLGVYYLQGRFERQDRSQLVPALVVAIIFAAIGILYSYNFPLMLRPESWSLYAEGSYGGFPDWLNPAVYPAFLHMLLGAVAISGLLVMIVAARKKSGTEEWSQWAVQFGGKMFTHATLLNIVIGIWFIFALPRDDMIKFMGANMGATHSLIMAFLLIAIALFLIFKARRSEKNIRLIYTGSGLTAIVLLLMAIMRQQF